MSQPHAPAVEIHLLELPVPLAAQAQQHVEELLREFALIQTGAAGTDVEHHVPARLLELVDTLTVQFAGVNDDARDRLEAAIARGDQVIADHVLTLPPEAAPASQALGAMLDECDAYCAAGQELLTLATTPDLVAYRRWYLSQVVAQLGGAAPTPWPAYARSCTGWPTSPRAPSVRDPSAAEAGPGARGRPTDVQGRPPPLLASDGSRCPQQGGERPSPPSSPNA